MKARRIKIAMIGASSAIFTKTFLNDILTTEALQNSTIALMSRGSERLYQMESFAKSVVKENNLSAKIYATTDRRDALDGADYCIVTIQLGGLDAARIDYEIPLRYGVDQCIGDTLGPGGVFRAVRTIPVILDIAKDMEEVCPDAILLNYTNPMGAICHALGCASKVRFVGLCHGVQTTLDLIARYVDEDKKNIDFLCAGINHMAWFLKLEKDGEDLYPKLKERVEQPEYYLPEKVRCEVMRHFGYFMTESTGHLSEYLPYFRKNERALTLYCDQPGLGGESGVSVKNAEIVSKNYRFEQELKTASTKLCPRSVEYCSYVIEALEGGKPFLFNGNVRNDDYITNLPRGCCVEVPIHVDRIGLHPVSVGELPPQLAALCQTNISVQTLCVEACLTGNPEHIFHAVALDPLTSAVLTLEEIRNMVCKMMDAERPFLSIFAGKTLSPKPRINIAPGTKPVKTPLDPALAIIHRLIKIGKEE